MSGAVSGPATEKKETGPEKVAGRPAGFRVRSRKKKGPHQQPSRVLAGRRGKSWGKKKGAVVGAQRRGGTKMGGTRFARF